MISMITKRNSLDTQDASNRKPICMHGNLLWGTDFLIMISINFHIPSYSAASIQYNMNFDTQVLAW